VYWISRVERMHWLLLVGLLVSCLSPDVARAQLEVLLRGVQPSLPQEGICAQYRFTSEEPDGSRNTEFIACVERVPATVGPVVLLLSSGDSIQVRIEVGRDMFMKPGSALTDHILRVEQFRNGEVQILTPEDWRKHPALAPAAELPVLADSSLGPRSFELLDGAVLLTQGRFRQEARTQEKVLSSVKITNTEDRRMDIWSAPQAPILGVVLANAVVRSERIFDSPIPGVPERGPRVMRYKLELLKILQSVAPRMGTKSR
jgi:hypothetical protein